jgi:hypothetical protein
MTLDGALQVTLRYILRGDMYLNGFLSCILLAFPLQIDRAIGQQPLSPPLVYRVIGLGFLVFALWQVVVVLRGRLDVAALAFAAFMAEAPVVVLTVMLIFMELALRPVWRAVLWIGDGYMLLLGAWYIFLARWQFVTKASTHEG